MRQKGVDMKIGLDIAAMAYKNHVDTIVLVTGDSDFIPAAKVARREGVEVILDPLWMNVDKDLVEHSDGLVSVLETPTKPKS
ncbi:MAG: NYN domain-containing protein [Pseudomonadota bacterium]